MVISEREREREREEEEEEEERTALGFPSFLFSLLTSSLSPKSLTDIHYQHLGEVYETYMQMNPKGIDIRIQHLEKLSWPAETHFYSLIRLFYHADLFLVPSLLSKEAASV